MEILLPIFFFLVFGLVLAVFVLTFVRTFGQWKKNNNSPRLTVDAKVVAKRTQVSHSGGNHHHMNSRYFVTFEVESGDRMELYVEGTQFGLMVEGDCGKLTFQGTRFLEFERGRPA